MSRATASIASVPVGEVRVKPVERPSAPICWVPVRTTGVSGTEALATAGAGPAGSPTVLGVEGGRPGLWGRKAAKIARAESLPVAPASPASPTLGGAPAPDPLLLPKF